MKTLDPEIDAALRAIGEGPDDDGRRRVLTDLLLERGDPRGEFLLLQFLIAENQASGATKHRAQALWRKHRRAWLGAVGAHFHELKVERGFPSEGVLHDVPAEALRAAFEAPMFATVERLQGSPAAVLEALASPRLRALREVELGAAVDFEQAVARAVPRRLTRLTLGFSLTSAEVTVLRESPVFARVEVLRLVQPSSALEVLARLSKHPALREVQVPRLTLSAVFAAWPQLTLSKLVVSTLCTLERVAHGTEVTLQNLTRRELLPLRKHLPADTVRVCLMPARPLRVETVSKEALLAAFSGFNPSLP